MSMSRVIRATLLAALVGAGCGAPPPPDVATPEPAGGASSAGTAAVIPPAAASASAAPSEPVGPAPAPDFAEYRKRLGLAQAAYEKKDFAGFLEHSSAASRAAPDSPRALYNLACAHALNGDVAGATGALDRLAAKRLYFDVAADSDFVRIKDSPAFAAARAKIDAVKAPVGGSATAFTLAQKDLIPEGIAHEAASGTFFVSSVHRRKIVRVAPGGKVTDLVKEGEHGLYAVLGIALDEARRSLYACSTAVPEMKGYGEGDKGKAGLFELDLATGKVKRKVLLAEAGKEHNLNDLVIDSKGEVIVSDPGASAVLSLAPGASAFTVLVPAGRLASPQGLALSADEKTLYVADYSRGLARVDRATGDVTYLTAPPDATLTGIDGLRAYSGDLVAVQNGVRPHRVMRLALTPDGAAVRTATLLEMNNPIFNEPTLGVVVGQDFVYVANSQWGSFDKGGAIWPAEKLKEPVILRVRLSP